MGNKYIVEGVGKLNTKQLIKLFPKVLGLTEQEFDALLFFTGLVFALEKILTMIIAGGLKTGITKELRDPNMIEFIIYELTLNAKVKIFDRAVRQDLAAKERYSNFLTYLRCINNLRNEIFHGKLTGLCYKEKSISDIKTQQQMLLDYFKVAKEATGRKDAP